MRKKGVDLLGFSEQQMRKVIRPSPPPKRGLLQSAVRCWFINLLSSHRVVVEIASEFSERNLIGFTMVFSSIKTNPIPESNTSNSSADYTHTLLGFPATFSLSFFHVGTYAYVYYVRTQLSPSRLSSDIPLRVVHT